MNTVTINVKNLVKRYGDVLALDHLNLEVNEGDVYGLLGPNGSGKSTAINCILSFINYEKGEISIFNKKLKSTSYDLKREIGFVPQELAVLDELSVYENVDFFCGLYVKDKKERKKLVEEAIEFVELTDFKKRTAKKLSGGLRRRLNIACGISHKPKLLILDEPTVAVDPQSRNNILEGMKKLNSMGVTIVYTTHYMEEVEKICNKISIIDNGKNLISGTKEELKAMVNLGDKVFVHDIAMNTKKEQKLKEAKFIRNITYFNNSMEVSLSKDSKVVDFLQLLEEHAVSYSKITVESPTLNDVFLEATGKELRDYE